MTDRLLFIVTGASGGFGSAILRQINLTYPDTAHIVACSRNTAKVEENCKDFTALVRHISVDFSEKRGLVERSQEIFDLFKDTSFKAVYLYNNHADVGDVTKLASDMDNTEVLQDYYFLNVISFQILTTVFLRSFPAARHIAVNISSLAAVQEMPSLSLYCSGKATRLMYYKCLAVESPDVRVFSWSPGPMDTAMFREIRDNSASSTTKDTFTSIETGNNMVDLDVSAKKMLDIVQKDKYKSGVQMDFYDRDL